MHDRIQRYLEDKISKFKSEMAYSSRTREDGFGQLSNILEVTYCEVRKSFQT